MCVCVCVCACVSLVSGFFVVVVFKGFFKSFFFFDSLLLPLCVCVCVCVCECVVGNWGITGGGGQKQFGTSLI